MNWYNTFNAIEAFLWLVVATVLFFRTPTFGIQQRLAVLLGCVAFIAFGATDLLELGRNGSLPLWLWGLKILCGAAILAARYTWLGWDKFHYYDREFLFGLGCLLAVLVIILCQQTLQHQDRIMHLDPLSGCANQDLTESIHKTC